MVSRPVRPGVRLVNGKLSILEEEVEGDEQIPADLRTARLLKAIANTISPTIRMQEDVPSNHPSGKLPILDLEVWVERGIIMHQFYKKPMASRMVVQARSAFPTTRKKSILLEEGLRRLRNCSPGLGWKNKVYFLNRFSSDLKFSGHTVSFRRTLLKRVIIKYEKNLCNHLDGKQLM